MPRGKEEVAFYFNRVATGEASSDQDLWEVQEGEPISGKEVIKCVGQLDWRGLEVNKKEET